MKNDLIEINLQNAPAIPFPTLPSCKILSFAIFCVIKITFCNAIRFSFQFYSTAIGSKKIQLRCLSHLTRDTLFYFPSGTDLKLFSFRFRQPFHEPVTKRAAGLVFNLWYEPEPACLLALRLIMPVYLGNI